MCDFVYDSCHTSESEESTERDDALDLKGYEDGMLTKYRRFCGGKNEQVVSCKEAKKVWVQLNVHELKSVDDQKEEFRVLFVLKLWWFDENVKDIVLNMKDGTQRHIRIKRITEDGEIHVERHLDKDEVLNLEPTPYKKTDYLSIQHEEDPDIWKKKFFFPKFNFLNLCSQPEALDSYERLKIEWSDEVDGKFGTFLRYERKFEATFSDDMNLKRFPLDRQLFRIKLIAQKPVEEVQFVLKTGQQSCVTKVCESFSSDKVMGVNTYVRWADEELPYFTQYSRVHCVMHLQREGGHFFKNAFLNIFLVNCLGLCAYGTLPRKLGDFLGILSACFLAVLAQRYVLNEELPRKKMMSLADWYLAATAVFQVIMCIVLVPIATSSSEFKRDAEEMFIQEHRMHCWGIGMFIVWLCISFYFWALWCFDLWRQDWGSVYHAKEEPYCPIWNCKRCGNKGLCKQADVKSKITCPACNDKDASVQFHMHKDPNGPPTSGCQLSTWLISSCEDPNCPPTSGCQLSTWLTVSREDSHCAPKVLHENTPKPTKFSK